MLGQELPIAVSALLTPPIGMHAEARRGLALANRHRQGVVDQVCPPLISHRPPDQRPRAQIQPHGQREPACARRKLGHIPDVDSLGGLHSQRPVALVRSARLGLASGRRRLAFTLGFAAQTRLGQDAPEATAAAWQARLRQQVCEPAGAVGATALCTIRLYLRLYLLRGVRVGAGGPAEPRGGATARDRQYPT